jgi:hypothetical protein
VTASARCGPERTHENVHNGLSTAISDFLYLAPLREKLVDILVGNFGGWVANKNENGTDGLRILFSIVS